MTPLERAAERWENPPPPRNIKLLRFNNECMREYLRLNLYTPAADPILSPKAYIKQLRKKLYRYDEAQ